MGWRWDWKGADGVGVWMVGGGYGGFGGCGWEGICWENIKSVYVRYGNMEGMYDRGF